jgi:hypothetical protein
MEPTRALLEAIAVTAELTGTNLSEPAAKVMAIDLAAYPEGQVLAALARCRRELKARLTVADVLTRIDDGRPGPEEAWAMIPKDEAASIVWTREMAEAYGVALPIMDAPVQARMAFLEAYRERVRKARDERVPVQWEPSLGHDPEGREHVLRQAVEKGRLTRSHFCALAPPAADISYHEVVEQVRMRGAA